MTDKLTPNPLATKPGDVTENQRASCQRSEEQNYWYQMGRRDGFIEGNQAGIEVAKEFAAARPPQPIMVPVDPQRMNDMLVCIYEARDKEIERLKIERQDDMHRHSVIARANGDLRAEIERLRGMLEVAREALKYYSVPRGGMILHTRTKGSVRACCDDGSTAREALEKIEKIGG